MAQRISIYIIIMVFALFLGAGLAGAKDVHWITPGSPGKILEDIRISHSSFNPSKGEELGIYYLLKEGAKVTVRVYDPDRDLVAVLINGAAQSKGKNSALWDGKDMDGRIVPDESYFVIIEAVDKEGNQEIYDPTVFSGGEEHDLAKATIDAESGTISYRLPEMGRVRIRLGISGGPLLYTLVDWKPRLAGEVTEYWNGKDQDNLMDLRDNPRFKMIISYFTLPENSVITYGNKKVSYFAYKESLKRPKKKEYPNSKEAERNLSRHYLMPRAMDRSPAVVMTFSNKVGLEGGTIPILKGKTLVHVELDEKSKPYFREMKYEICFFLNGEFYAEEETGYSPYNWLWDTSQVKPGTYILTANLSSFKDQIGILSKKVKVVKPKK